MTVSSGPDATTNDSDDGRWTTSKLVILGAVTLTIAFSIIYLISG